MQPVRFRAKERGEGFAIFHGKRKALTFSYDDGVLQDIRLIELFNRHGMKATFNLNSGLLGKRGSVVKEGVSVDQTRVAIEDVRAIYEGHEIAVHTLTHPNLTQIADDAEVFRQIERDRENLSNLAGYEVLGMAYPGGGVNCDARVSSIVQRTPIRYARTNTTTRSFAPDPDRFQYRPTLRSHNDWDALFDTGRRFLELKTDEPRVFFVWGHAYEFDVFPERWEAFARFLSMMSGRDDIFYGTNLEVLTDLEEKE